MFYVSDEGIINLTRGDSCSVPIFINKGTELNPMRYYIGDNDTVYFAIMEVNQSFEDAIVKKAFAKENANENGDVLLTLVPKDTENLLPGKYYYTLKLRTGLGADKYKVQTLIPNKELYIEV